MIHKLMLVVFFIFSAMAIAKAETNPLGYAVKAFKKDRVVEQLHKEMGDCRFEGQKTMIIERSKTRMPDLTVLVVRPYDCGKSIKTIAALVPVKIKYGLNPQTQRVEPEYSTSKINLIKFI